MELNELYGKALLKYGYSWLPGTPAGTYLESFDAFKKKVESDEDFYNKLINELDMTRKGYVVQSIGYEYNDEYYYRGECGGGIPQKVFFDEAKAMKKLAELEIEAFKGERLGDYHVSDKINDEDLYREALAEIDVDPDDWRVAIPKDTPDSVVKKLIKSTGIRFHEIVEVEVEVEDQVPDEEVQPSEEILDVQDSMSNKEPEPKKSITGSGVLSVSSDFMGGDFEPTEVPEEVTAKEIKEVVKETEDDFLTIKDEMKRLRDEARKKVKNFFIKGMNKIFDTYPEVKNVSWTQYTPYFNDGEECVFRAHTEYFYVNGADSYGDTIWGYHDDDFEGEPVLKSDELDYDWHTNAGTGKREKVYKHPESRSLKIHNAIKGFLEQLDDDDYKTMFGDHAMVVVSKDKVTVEEYEHD